MPRPPASTSTVSVAHSGHILFTSGKAASE
jgi:hypothetical protein